MMAGFVGLTVLGSLLAPEPEYNKHEHTTRLSFLPSVPTREAAPAVAFVAACWATAFGMIGYFAIMRLGFNADISSRVFVSEQGPSSSA